MGLAIDPDSKITQKDEALAGLFFFTVYLADRLGIDLETAFRNREKNIRGERIE